MTDILNRLVVHTGWLRARHGTPRSTRGRQGRKARHQALCVRAVLATFHSRVKDRDLCMQVGPRLVRCAGRLKVNRDEEQEESQGDSESAMYHHILGSVGQPTG